MRSVAELDGWPRAEATKVIVHSDLNPEGPLLPPGDASPRANERRQKKERRGQTLKFLAYVVLYYFTNSFVVLTNKQLISLMNFHFPVFLTALHMASTVAFSHLMLDVLKVFPRQKAASPRQRNSIRLLALQFAVSLLCGNWSLKYIDVSYMQMVGATTPFFVCLLGLAFFNTVYPARVYATLVPIVGGAIVSTCGKARGGSGFSMAGLALSLGATFFRGIKTVWQGHLLQGEEKLTSPNLLRFMAADAAIVLLLLGLATEARPMADWVREGGGQASGAKGESWRLPFLLVVNPLSAYCANYSQFMLIQLSSALTFQVIGNTKGLINVVTSMVIFGDHVTAMAATGYSITLFGVAAYIREKRRA